MMREDIMDMKEDLLPCPFCGGKQLHMHDDSVLTWVECEDCLAEGPVLHGYEKDAIKEWNRRA